MLTARQILQQPDHDAARLLHVRLARDPAWLVRAVSLVDSRDEYLASFRAQIAAGRVLTARQLSVAHRRIRPYLLWLVQRMRAAAR